MNHKHAILLFLKDKLYATYHEFHEECLIRCDRSTLMILHYAVEDLIKEGKITCLLEVDQELQREYCITDAGRQNLL